MKKRMISTLVALCMTLALLPAYAVAAEDMVGQTAVIYTANVRGDIDVYAKAAALKADYEQRGAQVIMADVGNYLQGTVYASADCGETIISLMDGLYDVAAVGAHEFDWNNSSTGTVNHGDFVQYKNLFTLASQADFDMISANVTRDGDNVFDPSAVIETKSGLKVAFVGLTAPQNDRVFPDDCEIFNTLSFMSGNDMARAVNQAIAGLEADAVICLSNVGGLDAGSLEGAALIDVAAADAASAGVMVLDGDGQVVSSETIALGEYEGVDSTLAAEIEKIKLANVNALFARSEVVLSGQNQAACRGETNLGDLWTDALRWFATEGGISEYYDEDDVTAGNTGIAVDNDHVVALWNGGNLRADVNIGTVTEAEISAVLPYPNRVAVVYMTGSQLVEALEAASQGMPFTQTTANANNAFMQVAGLKYTVDASKAYDAGEAYGEHWFRANSLGRVTITEVNGKAFDANATYAVITSNANYNGMDSSYIFAEAAKADTRSTITTAVVRDVVWMYIKNELDSNIGQQYAQPQGRITVSGRSFADVAGDAWYADEVAYVAQHGLMNGLSDTEFGPAESTSRAMMVTILYRLAGSPQVETEGQQWYAEGRQWALDNGVSDGSNMTANISREQIATMLYRNSGSAQANGGLSAFADSAEVSDWAEDAVRWAVEQGILQGADGRLNPGAAATRAEMAAILMRYNTAQ